MSPRLDLSAITGGRDDALETFLAWTADQGFTLYPAQEEALLEVFSGAHVIVNTPTGSGKSLVALGAHVAALAGGMRSFYTAPVKALVSEKFFALCGDLGAENVGMLTGDASINPTAPVVCATAEIVANMALRSGADAGIDQVVMDEFHFYGDPDRGWAWQVPLLELTRAQFVLMSATLGDTRKIEQGLERRTGRPVSVVRSATRPVPLRFEYRRTPLHETIESLLAADQAPLYVVYFTQAQVLTAAQALTSAQVTTRAEREAIAEAIVGFRFAPGFGRTLARLSPPRDRRPSRRDAAEVPPPGGTAHEGRPAPGRRRDRHARSRDQHAVAHGRAVRARQVRRLDLPAAERQGAAPDRRARRAGRLRLLGSRRRAGARPRHRERTGRQEGRGRCASDAQAREVQAAQGLRRLG